MKVTVYVQSAEEIAAARASAEPSLQDGDELEVIVSPRAPVAAQVQPARQAIGYKP